MKNCPKCGAVQKDERKTCVECGAELTCPTQKPDPFHLGIFGILIVIADILGVIASVVLLYFLSENHEINRSWCFTSAVLFILAAVDTGIPELNWHFYELGMEFRHGVSNPEPSDYYLFKWKLAIIAVPVICYIGLAMYLPFL